MIFRCKVQEIIAKLGFERHPEGGWYRETFADRIDGQWAHSTAIYYLLEGDDRSHWHRVDAVEVWHYYAGAPLSLSLSADGERQETVRLGPDVLAGELPQVVVPKFHWQGAQSTGA